MGVLGLTQCTFCTFEQNVYVQNSGFTGMNEIKQNRKKQHHNGEKPKWLQHIGFGCTVFTGCTTKILCTHNKQTVTFQQCKAGNSLYTQLFAGLPCALVVPPHVFDTL